MSPKFLLLENRPCSVHLDPQLMTMTSCSRLACANAIAQTRPTPTLAFLNLLPVKSFQILTAHPWTLPTTTAHSLLNLVMKMRMLWTSLMGSTECLFFSFLYCSNVGDLATLTDLYLP